MSWSVTDSFCYPCLLCYRQSLLSCLVLSQSLLSFHVPSQIVFAVKSWSVTDNLCCPFLLCRKQSLLFFFLFCHRSLLLSCLVLSHIVFAVMSRSFIDSLCYPVLLSQTFFPVFFLFCHGMSLMKYFSDVLKLLLLRVRPAGLGPPVPTVGPRLQLCGEETRTVTQCAMPVVSILNFIM